MDILRLENKTKQAVIFGSAFVTTGADAALVLEQVAIFPIPSWWPCQGMQIPEDDNLGAPMLRVWDSDLQREFP